MRIAAEVGQRAVAVRLTEGLFAELGRPGQRLDEPLLPACGRYDGIVPGEDLALWLAAAVGEQYERLRSYSSCFDQPWSGLAGICASIYASAEMLRRQALCAVLSGAAPVIDGRLLETAPDHRNAGLWQSGFGLNVRA